VVVTSQASSLQSLGGVAATGAAVVDGGVTGTVLVGVVVCVVVCVVVGVLVGAVLVVDADDGLGRDWALPVPSTTSAQPASRRSPAAEAATRIITTSRWQTC